MKEKELRKIERELLNELSDAEFFVSPAYQIALGQVVRVMLGGVNGYLTSLGITPQVVRRAHCIVECSPQKKALAYTDGKAEHFNVGHPFVETCSTRLEKDTILKGLAVHETAHILFTDFPSMKQWVTSLLNGKMWPYNVKGIPTALLPSIAKPAKELQNALEDGYIEREIMLMYPGTVSEWLAYCRERQFKGILSLEEDLKTGNSKYNCLFNQILCYAKYSKMKIENKQSEKLHELVDILQQCAPIIDANRVERNPIQRYALCNELLAVLLDYFEKAANEAQKDGQTVADILDDLPGDDLSPDSLDALPDTTSVVAQVACDAEGMAQDVDVPSLTATEKAAIQEEAKRRLKESEQAALNSRWNDSPLQLELIRMPDGNKDEYNSYLSSVRKISSKLQRQMQAVIKQRAPQCITGLPSGKRVDAARLYKTDGRIFTRNIQGMRAEIAVGVLLDQSGSTYSLIGTEIQAAILLEDVCKGLGVPHYIYGYDNSLYMYTDAQVTSSSYSLPQACAAGGTFTASATAYLLNALKRHSDKKKLLFIITDGSSSDSDALPAVLERARRERVTIIAAGIGGCRKEVEEEFGKNFVDISQIESLPTTISKILKKEM